MPAEPEGPSPIRRFVLPALFVIALFVALFMRRPGPVEAHKLSGPTMGTTWNVTVVAPLDAEERAELQQIIAGALEAVNASMSTYKADSALSTFNRHQGTGPVDIPPDLLTVVSEAQRISEWSGGAFDATVGPLVRAWGFGPDTPGEPPDEATLGELRERVGYAKLTIDPARSTLAKRQPDVDVDLSAIAKGFGTDQVARALEAAGHDRYMVEVGGEVRARGTNIEGTPWRIGVEKPSSDLGRAVYEVVPLQDLAMATSGDYRNYRETADGKRFSHTIDPRTGRPIEHRLASVTVLHPSCMTADAMATALNVLGPEAGYALAEREKVAAFFLVRKADGTFEEKATPAFEALRKK